jgi:hypothetical protein
MAGGAVFGPGSILPCHGLCQIRFEQGLEDGPMEKHIAPVMNGAYGEKAQLINQNKIETMNAENLEYLQKQLLYAGFGEGLNTQLERKLKEGMPDFQLNGIP